MEAAPKGRNINGKGVLFKSLNSDGGDWTSKGITFANGLDLSAYDRILLNLNGDGGGEKLRIQFWDENGKYIDWIQTIDFTGWRTLCLPLSDAMHGFDFKKVKCFIVLYNGLPIYNECSVALADMRGLHKGDNIPQVVGSENVGYIPMSSLKTISNDEAAFYRNQIFTTPEVTASPSPEQVTGYAMTLGDGVPMRNYPDTNGEIITLLPYTSVAYVFSQQYSDAAWHLLRCTAARPAGLPPAGRCSSLRA